MNIQSENKENNVANEESTPQEDSKSISSAELAARREARRRKILENSNNRLGRLTGREHNEPPLEESELLSACFSASFKSLRRFAIL